MFMWDTPEAIHAFLYGDGTGAVRGLLPGPPTPLPPDTMTRQRRRHAERERAKGR
jgi:hypothetical protein